MASLRAAGTVLASLLLITQGIAADTKTLYLYPMAGQQGTTVAVALAGKFEPWPPQVWVDAKGIVFKPEKTAGKFDVEIAKDAVPGPHFVRFFNDRETSAPKFFIVSRDPETLEVEPNDDFKSPQKIATLPATISGRLDKSGDVDSFAVTLHRGQVLIAWVEAYVLGSPFDGMLRIVDEKGFELAFNHDGRTLDPFLAWEAPRDGTFVVQLMGFAYPPSSEERFTGNDGCVYRLHFTAGPFVRYSLPLSVPRGKVTSVRLVGWNLPSAQAEIDTTQITAETNAIELPLPGIVSDQPLPVSDLPELMEVEPNDTTATAQALDLPSAVTGNISKPSDEDRFSFTAAKGKRYELAVTAARIGSPLIAWLKVENKDGMEFARNEDPTGSRDPRLTWTASDDGVVFAAIGDVTHHGGDNYVYSLAISEASPSVFATVSEHSIAVQPGKTGELKVAVKRANEFKPKLHLAAKNLPEGITADEVEIPEKDGDVSIKINAPSEAKPASQPFQLVLRETESGKEYPVHHRLTTSGEDNGVPQGYTSLVIDEIDQLWITIPPQPPKAEAAKDEAVK